MPLRETLKLFAYEASGLFSLLCPSYQRKDFCANKGLSRSAAVEKETRWGKIGEAVVSVKGGDEGKQGRRVIIKLISAPSTLISNRMKNNMSKQSVLKTPCEKSSFYIISPEVFRRLIH